MHTYRPQRNFGCRIHDQYTYMGMRTLVLENDVVRISLLLDKGTDIFEYLYKAKDLDYVWLTANGVQHPSAYLPTSPDPIATFIDTYLGGWQEVFPNGGPTSVYAGAQYGQHGEVSHMPWDYELLADTPEHIAVRLSVRTKKAPYRVEKTLSLHRGSAELRVEERIDNLSRIPLRYMWGQHIAFGRPFLDSSCIIRMPEGVKVVTEALDSVAGPGRIIRANEFNWPNGFDANGETVDLSRLPAPDTTSDIVYLKGFGQEGSYSIENPKLQAGFRMEWDAVAMPYVWYWQEFGATQGYPWYGRHYNIGLEPFCGYPTHGLNEAIRNDSAGAIGPGETRTFWMKTSPFVC